MFKKIIAQITKKNKGKKQSQNSSQGAKFTGRLKKDEQTIRDILKDCGDVKYKNILIPTMGKRKGLLVYVEGLINMDTLNRDIIAPLNSSQKKEIDDITELLSTGETSNFQYGEEVANEILSGKIGILVDGNPEIVSVDSQEWPMRAIEEPLQERLIRGPREGFTEVIQMNLGLIRRRLLPLTNSDGKILTANDVVIQASSRHLGESFAVIFTYPVYLSRNSPLPVMVCKHP